MCDEELAIAQKDREHPIFIAIKNCDFGCLMTLLDSGMTATPYVLNYKGIALSMAVKDSVGANVITLIRCKADPNVVLKRFMSYTTNDKDKVTIKSGESVFMASIRRVNAKKTGYYDQYPNKQVYKSSTYAEILIDHKADVNMRQPVKDRTGDIMHMTPLECAVYYENLAVINPLVNAKADVNEQPSLLGYFAERKWKSEVLEKLLELKIDPNGGDMISQCTQNQNPYVLRCLIDSKAHVDQSYRDHLICTATQNQDNASLRLLL